MKTEKLSNAHLVAVDPDLRAALVDCVQQISDEYPEKEANERLHKARSALARKRNIWLYVEPGGTTARFTTVPPVEFDLRIVSGQDGEFAAWQLIRLTERLAENYSNQKPKTNSDTWTNPSNNS